MPVKIVRIRDDARVPERKSDGAAGADLFAAEEKTIYPGCRDVVWTGLRMEIPYGFEGQIRSRSGLALKHGVIVLNAPGTIDSDYRGEVGVILGNYGHAPYEIEIGDRIAQIVIASVPVDSFIEVEEIDETERGSGGFGSTGTT